MMGPLEKRDGAAEAAIASLLEWVSEKYNRSFPADYIEFLRDSIGIDCRKTFTDDKRYLRTGALTMGWDEQEASGASYTATLLGLLQVIAP